jgi:glycosyltransferase involved in cell wall biosynthesis
MISAIVICKDEEANISGCLESLAWCDEIVVVDAMSTDQTARIAEGRGARVFRRPWPGYSAQRNFALDQCRGDWCLYLDADERLSAGFADEARAAAAESGGPAGYWVSTLEYFMGDFLQHGGYGRHQANRKVRFWRNRPEHRFHGAVHERVGIDGPLGTFTSHVEHFSSSSTLTGLLSKLNRYTDLEATEGPPPAPSDLIVAPTRVFLSRYVKHQGFRDGTRGLVMAQVNAFYALAAVAKRLERELLGAGHVPEATGTRKAE